MRAGDPRASVGPGISSPCIGVHAGRFLLHARRLLAVAAAPVAVVAAERVAIRLILILLDEFGSVLDLVLGPVDVNDFCFAVDPIDHTGGQHDLLTEDPRPRIDDQPACAGLVVGVVDLTDVAVEGFDRISGQVATRGSLVGVSPYSSLYVSSTSSSTHNHHLPFYCWCHRSK